MKKILLITALLLIAVISANAQYGFGVKTGASIFNMSIDNLDNRWGINTGILGQYKFGETAFAMQTEVLFNIQGAAYQANFLGQNIAKGKYELMYITVPMLMRFYIIPGLNVEFGPQFGFLTSAKIKPNSGDDIKVKDDMKTFDGRCIRIAHDSYRSLCALFVRLNRYIRYSFRRF
ncbi:MAG: PorT family protein [Prevotellaceae bacterium]|jgi:hypothetical protein|nr:PorT family protein [Prevotellaceae bacterium]